MNLWQSAHHQSVSVAMQTAAQESSRYMGNGSSWYSTTPAEPESVRGKVCPLFLLSEEP